MKDIVQHSEIERITLVDAIGMPIRIPMEFCHTYAVRFGQPWRPYSHSTLYQMLLDVINLYFRHKKAPESEFVERGDYRLVHGDRKNTVGRTEWARINKVGLKMEMSVILRTRNQSSTSCPSCSTLFEGHAKDDGWTQW
jgi:hypothetical protein